MLASIQLNGRLHLWIVEIQYETLEWVLPAEFVSTQTPVAQELPETTFKIFMDFSE
jgi:hypothetical protein